MQHATTFKPSWTFAARETDISDVWVDEVDPQNEVGAEVTAFFAKDGFGSFELSGIRVNEDDVPLFYDREHSIKFLGMDAVWRVESVEMEVPGDPVGDAMDRAWVNA